MASFVGRRAARLRLPEQWLVISAVIGGPILFAILLLVWQNMGHSDQSATRPVTDLDPQISGGLIGRASVIDGDTIEIHGQRIRLSGIDAPESAQQCEANGVDYRCGQKAAFALSDFLLGRIVDCQQTGRDRYLRIIAKCSANGVDVGDWMVSHGWAIAYRKYSSEYIATENDARDRKAGIWSGTFMNPDQWRHKK